MTGVVTEGRGRGRGSFVPSNRVHLAFQSPSEPLCDSAGSVCVSRSNRALAPEIEMARFIRRR
jgi:hypothetical protein